MNPQIAKIKNHLKENKKIYIAAVTGVAVGVVSVLVLNNKTDLVNVRPVQILTWKSKQTIDVFIEALGDPGNIIQDMTTGTIYASQGQAARELGLNPSRISDQLNGRTAHVKNHIFERLGKAVVAA